MSAAVAERAMVQPTHLYVPPRAGSLGVQVTEVSASVGRILDEEQRLTVDALTSRKANGTPASLEAAVISCRQNLKTFVAEDIVLTYLVEPDSDVRLIIWSAHLFDTAQETFRHFDELCASYSHLSSRVLKISRGNGEEEIEFRGGRRLKFKARSKSGGRGLTGDVVVLDEGFALEPGHMGALLPTLSTRRRAQVLYLSSAGMGGSAVLRGVRDRGRRGGAGAPAYVEWCAPGSLAEPGCVDPQCHHQPGTPGCSLDREDLWQQANPALGRRIAVEFVRKERAALPPEEFARERLGWWDAPADESVSPISAEAWAACAVPVGPDGVRPDGTEIEGVPVLGLDVSPSRGSAAVCLAGRRGDGLVQVEVVAHRSGEGWVLPELRRAYAAGMRTIAVDGKSQAMALKADLEEVGYTVQELGAADAVQACIGLQRDVLAGDRLRHLGDDILARALSVATARPVGDGGGWAWARKRSDGDITPLVAVTVARWALPQVEAQASVVPLMEWGD